MGWYKKTVGGGKVKMIFQFPDLCFYGSGDLCFMDLEICVLRIESFFG